MRKPNKNLIESILKTLDVWYTNFEELLKRTIFNILTESIMLLWCENIDYKLKAVKEKKLFVTDMDCWRRAARVV